MKKTIITMGLGMALSLSIVSCGGGTSSASFDSTLLTVGENGNWFYDKTDLNFPHKDENSAYEDYKSYYPNYTKSEEGWQEAVANGELQKPYNIIMTAATIPPVLSSLEAFENEYETYAWIERGKTYSGIEDVEQFHNIGFNVTENLGAGVLKETMTKIVSTIKKLNKNKDEHFHIYTTDYKALTGLYAAADSKLTENQFTVHMVEDGSGTYEYLRRYFINGKTAASATEHFKSKVEEYRALFEDVMENGVASIADEAHYNVYVPGYDGSFPLACLDQFQYDLQSAKQIENAFGSIGAEELQTIFQVREGTSTLKANVKYKSIDEHVEGLSEEKKNQYLTLMFGDLKQGIIDKMTRTTLDDGVTKVPSKKLIFIGTRLRQSSLNHVRPMESGELVEDYASLAEDFKEVFQKEEDYQAVYNFLNDNKNLPSGLSQEEKEAVKYAAINNYIGYVFNLKLTYRLYGDEYDIIVKGHPSESMEEVSKWSYSVKVGEKDVYYSEMMNKLAKLFHSSDSEGKYCAMIPYGCAAENLAYLGIDHVIGGLPSSTYTGYSEKIPVLFILDQSRGNTNCSTDDNIKARYEQGTLEWNIDGEELHTTYVNRGNLYRLLRDYYKGINNTTLEEKYEGLYRDWIETTFAKTNGEDFEIDDAGFLVNK